MKTLFTILKESFIYGLKLSSVLLIVTCLSLFVYKHAPSFMELMIFTFVFSIWLELMRIISKLEFEIKNSETLDKIVEYCLSAIKKSNENQEIK